MTRRFDCPKCDRIHAVATYPQSLRNVAPNGELSCPECGEVWTVAVNPSGVVARRGDEVHAWLEGQRRQYANVELIEELIIDYTAHADQRISLEEPLVKP
jgi:transcription elongation factor Elf1